MNGWLGWIGRCGLCVRHGRLMLLHGIWVRWGMSTPGSIAAPVGKGASDCHGARSTVSLRSEAEGETRAQALAPGVSLLPRSKEGPAPLNGNGSNTEGLNSPWCNRGHFAVATFLHREVFKTAQRREWHVDTERKMLRHMTRGRVLRVESELHDGQRMQIFNVHQVTYSFSSTHGRS